MGFADWFRWGYGATKNPLSVERDIAGNWFYRMFSSSGSFTSLTTDREKIEMILKSPAVLKVFKLNADLTSLGKVTDESGKKTIKDHQARPNKHQTWKQFFYDYSFYSMLGTAYLWRSNGTNLDFSETQFYWLNPAKITFPNSLDIKLDKLDLSNKSINDIGREYIQYRFRGGSVKDIPLKEIQPFFDISNSVSENWYKGNSSIDALYRVISNSNLVIEAENVNIDFSRKFLVSGKAAMSDTTSMAMGKDDKESVESVVSSEKSVHATKSGIEINRFVDDLAKLKLSDAYIAQYFIIGSMYGIPRDVLDANLRGSTYENQEKSTGKHISYSIQPRMDDLMEWMGEFMGVDLKVEYTHLPFMQVFEKDRADTMKLKTDSLKTLIDSGFTAKDAAKIVGIEI